MKLADELNGWTESRAEYDYKEAVELMWKAAADLTEAYGLLREGLKFPGGEAPLWRKRVKDFLHDKDE